MAKRCRAKKASQAQKELLLSFLEADLDLANDNIRFANPKGTEIRYNKWMKMSLQLNALGGSRKDAMRWRKYWMDLRKNTGAKYNAIMKDENKTFLMNGPMRSKRFSSMEERIRQLTQTADGRYKVVVGFGLSGLREGTSADAFTGQVFERATEESEPTADFIRLGDQKLADIKIVTELSDQEISATLEEREIPKGILMDLHNIL